jgi:hypothetical protein
MPARGDAFIDYASLTVPIVSRQEQTRLVQWLDEERNFPGVETRSRRARTHRYRRSYSLVLDSGHECLLEVDPIHEGNFLRLDFNPCHTRGSLRQIVRRLQSALPGISMRDVARGRTTRLDIAFDVRGLDLQTLDAIGRLRLRDVRRYQVMHAYEQRGRLNAIEIGAKDAPSQFRIYDKKAQLEAAALRVGGRRLFRGRVRFELQQRNWGLTSGVIDSDNPFTRYDVYSHELVAATPPTSVEEHLFRLAVQGRGAQAVLSGISNQRSRDRYRQMLITPAPPAYWEPALIWQEFQSKWRELIDFG